MNLRNRWSPRAFSEKPVPAEVLRAFSRAARWAPSSNNEQPWAYLVPPRTTQKLRQDVERASGILMQLGEARTVLALQWRI